MGRRQSQFKEIFIEFDGSSQSLRRIARIPSRKI